MRLFRTFVVIALTAVLARPLAAQASTVSWQDSWYWGLYGGQLSFPTVVARTTAPTIGADWLITRSNFALRVFTDQSYFDAVSTVTDFPTGAARQVSITDLRRVGAAATIFTPNINIVRPYVGLGYAFNYVRESAPLGTYFASAAAKDSIDTRINKARSAGKLFGQFGVMATWRRWAPFVEYTVMPTQGAGTWLINGKGFSNAWALGVRYNAGSSIDKKW